ncbi:MAG: flagellar basal body-associated FliL family protein [Anaerolineaceae bacterium]|jgi:flagellar FliL protein
MQTISKILNVMFKAITIILFLIIGLLTIAVAYIMFAPDDMPKPFTLVYATPITPASSFLGDVAKQKDEPTLVPTAVPTPVILPGEGVMINMSTKIINLADTSGRRYIRLTVVLEFAPKISATEEVKKTEEEVDPNETLKADIDTRMPLMDDVVITMLSTKTYEELYTADGKEALRKEIMNAINARLPEFRVISVYFTEFVVQ